MILREKYLEQAKMFKAFCDEKRLNIIDLLLHGEKCACALMKETGMAQSALSYHMKILSDANIVKARQEGKWTFYKLNNEGLKEASNYILEIAQKNKG